MLMVGTKIKEMKMTIRLTYAQARALDKLDRREPRSPAEIGETRATCDALVTAGYAGKFPRGTWDTAYVKIKEFR